MNPILLRWLAPLGVTATSKTWIYWLIAVAAIALVVYIADVICRRAIIPLVKKFTRVTRATWDNILLNDTLLKDISRLVPPILIAVLMPLAFSGGEPLLEFLLKVNTIYLVVVIAKLLCTFFSSLYELSNSQNGFKTQSLKGVYQMLKIVVVCVALIIIVTYLSALTFYAFEEVVNRSVENFGTALWWAGLNVTTVGAPMFAVTPVGKILTVMLPGLGMILFPLLTVYVTHLVQRSVKA